jgi:methionyl-tRNA formyltransferase
MRVVFMGSPEIACVALQALLRDDAIEVVGIVAQPDRPSGRGKRVTACAVSRYAREHGLDLFTPQRVNHADAIAHIARWCPDVGAVVAYGQILRRELLQIPPLGLVNVHTSLLPKYRGAAPIQRAVANGDRETGVSLMQMDEGMDTGPILGQSIVPIGDSDTAGNVHDRLAQAGAAMLPSTLKALSEGRITPIPQDDTYATMAPKLKKEEGRLDWTQPARALYNRIRGFNPWPGCFCQLDSVGKRRQLRVLEARLDSGLPVKPGTIVRVDDGLVVACGEGALKLVQVQPEGKKPMESMAFLRGYPLQVGDQLG